MGIDTYYNKLNNDAKAFIEKNHNVPEAKTFAEGPFIEEKNAPVEEISVFEGLNGEVAVGDQSAFAAFMKIAQKQNLTSEQMPKGYAIASKEDVEEDVVMPTFNITSCQVVPEMGC